MKKKVLIAILLILVIAGVIYLVIYPKPLKVASFSPSDGAKNVSIDATGYVVFDRNLSDSEKNNISLKIKPDVEITSSWSGRQVNFAAKTGFKTRTTYTVEVDYTGTGLTSFSFTTADFTKEELIKQAVDQYPAERQFSEEWAKYINDNPWLTGLPIENANYRIVYDPIQKSFRIRILVSTTSFERQQFVNQALNDLKNIGVDKYFKPIPYYVLSQ